MKKFLGILCIMITLCLGIFYSRFNHSKEDFHNDNISIEIQNAHVKEVEILYSPQKFQGIRQIKEKGEKLPYNIYSYKGDIGVIIGGETMSLTQVLEENPSIMEVILNKAMNDKAAGIAKGEVYEDGGSELYQYPTYSILKCNTLDGNQDVYIGSPKMNINDLI